MARIRPLRGIRFNQQQVDALSQVVAPPYDVISESLHRELCARHPRNVVRLILASPDGNSENGDAFYKASAECFQTWLADGTLKIDPLPAIYLTAVDFAVEERTYTRYGMVAGVGLEPFENKVVLPHERTSSRVKTDRLNLMKAACANYCQIFSLYVDPDNIVLELLIDAVREVPPEVDLVDSAGERHRLWPIADPDVIDQVATSMKDKQLYIADGHHRYETALNYQRWVAENDPRYNEDHPVNYVLMYLSCTSDPGLVILPTHRLLTRVSRAAREQLLRQAAEFFDIQEIPFQADGRVAAQEAFLAGLGAGASISTIGLVVNERPVFYLLTPRPDAVDRALGDDVPRVLRALDVTILTQILLVRLLGYSQAELDEEKVVDYCSNAAESIEAVLSGRYDVAFLLNPTRNDQMQSVAAEGKIMPRKTTFYYPKVLTGLVMCSKHPDQQ